MTPKEKARELRDKMYLKIPSVYDPTGMPHYPIAKEMALIAANEVLNEIPYINNTDKEALKRVFWIYTIEEIEKL